MKSKAQLRKSAQNRGRRKSPRNYRSARERSTSGQSQTLWTLMVTIAFVLAALSQFRSGNRMALYEEQKESVREPANVIVEKEKPSIKPIEIKKTEKPEGLNQSLNEKVSAVESLRLSLLKK